MRHGSRLVSLILLLCIAGCTGLLRPNTIATILPGAVDQQVVDRLTVLAVAKDGKTQVEVHGWYQRSQALEYRWTHDKLEDFLDSAHRYDLKNALGSGSRHVAATATIGLARVFPNRYGNELAAIIGSADYPTPVRCAAAEMLGFNQQTGRARLARLIDRLWKFGGDKLPPNYDRQLHAQLLLSYGKFVSPIGNERFDQVWDVPLPSQSEGPPHLRLALIQVWQDSGERALDEHVLNLLDSPSQSLRIAVLKLIGRTGNTDFVAEVAHALEDRNLQVAAAAAEALGEMRGHVAAVVHLRDKAKQGALPVRVASLRALARHNEWSVVAEMTKDKAWQLRQAAAESLAGMPLPQAQSLAVKLAHDKSNEVVKSTLRAVRSWPESTAADVYFTALDNEAYLIRKAAARAFGARWNEARRFPVASSKRSRDSALARLKQKWAKVAGTPPNSLKKKSVGGSRNGPLSPIDRGKERTLVFSLEEAESSAERQAVLNQLAQLLDSETAQLATAKEVQQALKLEQGAAAWVAGLRCLHGQPWPAISKTWSQAKSHRSPDVRTAAAQLLCHNADAAPAHVWAELLNDRDTQVVVAALNGIRDHSLPASQVRSIKALIQHDDYHIRVAAAASLAKHGQVSGTAALERFALDDDARIRRLAARQYGALKELDHIGVLIEMLDDESSVSLIALDSLTQIVGNDSPNFGGDTQSQRIRRWKRWYKQRQRERRVAQRRRGDD